MKTIQRGANGPSVKLCQERLSRHGFACGAIDGDFGPQTEQAVLQFQNAHGLKADGVVGAETWGFLMVEERAAVSEDARNDQRMDLLAKLLAGDAAIVPRAALTYAIQDLGAHEEPDGSNTGPQISHLVAGYCEYWQIAAMEYYAWCAMACSVWIGRGLDLGYSSQTIDWHEHPFGGYFGGVSQIYDWASDQDRLHEPSTYAHKPVPPGALCIMPRAGSGSDAAKSTATGHVDMVLYDNLDGTVTVIGGNVANAVSASVRTKADMTGFAIWW